MVVVTDSLMSKVRMSIYEDNEYGCAYHIHRLEVRSTDTAMCIVRRSNNTFGDQCFASAGPHLWNRLPVYLRQCDSLADNVNSCWKLICLVLETAAVCDIFVRSAVYKYSYLLTYTAYIESYTHLLLHLMHMFLPICWYHSFSSGG